MNGGLLWKQRHLGAGQWIAELMCWCDVCLGLFECTGWHPLFSHYRTGQTRCDPCPAKTLKTLVWFQWCHVYVLTCSPNYSQPVVTCAKQVTGRLWRHEQRLCISTKACGLINVKLLKIMTLFFWQLGLKTEVWAPFPPLHWAGAAVAFGLSLCVGSWWVRIISATGSTWRVSLENFRAGCLSSGSRALHSSSSMVICLVDFFWPVFLGSTPYSTVHT